MWIYKGRGCQGPFPWKIQTYLIYYYIKINSQKRPHSLPPNNIFLRPRNFFFIWRFFLNQFLITVYIIKLQNWKIQKNSLSSSLLGLETPRRQSKQSFFYGWPNSISNILPIGNKMKTMHEFFHIFIPQQYSQSKKKIKHHI